MWRTSWASVRRSLLDFVFPETCILCDARAGDVPWSPGCRPGPGTDPTDVPHLCADCAPALAPAPVAGEVAGRPLFGGRVTDANLVAALGAWKYRGARGLACPLTAPIAAAVAAAVAAHPVGALVPVPLHARRHRQRGFNQARILARRADGPPVADLLERTRATGQQARLGADEARSANVRGAFRCRRPPAPGEDPRVGLVDDLVTSGATTVAAGDALAAGGWEVAWIACVGVASGVVTDGCGQQVDTTPPPA